MGYEVERITNLIFAVVILAEDKAIQDKLAYYDLKVQTFEEVQPMQIYPARVLSHIFAHLGKCSVIYATYKTCICVFALKNK